MSYVNIKSNGFKMFRYMKCSLRVFIPIHIKDILFTMYEYATYGVTRTGLQINRYLKVDASCVVVLHSLEMVNCVVVDC